MKRLLFAALLLSIAGACAHSQSRAMAVATIAPTTASSTVAGTVHLQELEDGSVQVNVDLTGVPPGVHGFHIHQNGSCADAGNAAGGHFNPTSEAHGAPTAAPHHAGDFGNVTAGAGGVVHHEFVTRSITLGSAPSSAIGHAVILHANPDDLVTQPTGNAGGRIACGVVQAMSAM